MLSEYEITYVSDPNLTDEVRGQLDAIIDAEITKLDGAIAQSSPQNRRRLSYPIQKQTAAFLRTVNIQLAPAHVASLQAFLRKKKELLRHTLLNTPPRQEITPDMLFKAPTPEGEKEAPRLAPTKKSHKEVTMKEVEAGIEEALQEEVK